VILAYVVLTQYRNVTDEQTDAQTMAKTREALQALARKNVLQPTCKSRLETA